MTNNSFEIDLLSVVNQRNLGEEPEAVIKISLTGESAKKGDALFDKYFGRFNGSQPCAVIDIDIDSLIGEINASNS